MSESQNIPELLQRIHRYHRQLNELAARRTKADRKVQIARKKHQDALARLETVKKEQTQIVLAAREKEKLVAQSEAALAKRRTQLLEAKNNKEHQSLKEQIDTDLASNNRLADEALDLMGKAEEFETHIADVTMEITEAEKGIAASEALVQEEGPILVQDIELFSGKLAETIELLPREYKGIYERMVALYGGENGMAPIVDQSFCGNCRQQIPIRYIAQICENKPFVCQSCGRLIFIPEGFVLK